jgi:acetyl-CoA synthase
MPKALKELVGERLTKTAKELYNIDDFASKIADETVCEEDTDKLLAFLQEKQHPVMNLQPMM